MRVPPRNYLLPLAIVLTTVLLTGCPQQTAIWLSKTSKAGKVVFGIGSKRGKPGGVSIGVIRVDRCEGTHYPQYDDALWVLSVTTKTQDLKELVYGETPAGFQANHGPLPLTPGCYEASVSGTGHLRFEVDAQGLARERK